VDAVADIDVVPDVADPDQPGHGRFGGGALGAVGRRPGQCDVAVLGGPLHAVGPGDVRHGPVIRPGGQQRVTAEVAVRRTPPQVVVHGGYPGDPTRGGRRLQVLRVARHRAVECYISADAYDGDTRWVDHRVEAEFCFDGRTDVLGLGHLPDPFPWVDEHLPLVSRFTPKSRLVEADSGSPAMDSGHRPNSPMVPAADPRR